MLSICSLAIGKAHLQKELLLGIMIKHHFLESCSVFTNKPSLILEETLQSLQFEEQFEGALSKT